MKKIFLFGILLLLILGFSKPTYAENLGVGLFCDKGLYLSDNKLQYNYEYEDDYKYVKGDIVSCYLTIYYDGTHKYNATSFVIGESDLFKFVSFEKLSVWDSEDSSNGKYTLKTSKELTGSMVVGTLRYEMLEDGDDLQIPIKEFYINDYNASGGEFFGIVNDSSGEHIYIPDEKPEEKKEEKQYEEADIIVEPREEESRVYTYILISLIMLIILFILSIIKNYMKERRMFD